jgi:general stress protein 26
MSLWERRRKMSEEERLKGEVIDYISKTRFAILATVKSDKLPELRTIGSFAPDGFDVYFSTGKDTAKVKQIELNNLISFFFQHEGQELSTFKNVALIGKAERLEKGGEFDKAIELLGNRNPRFKERVEKGGLEKTAIFKVTPKEVKYLDFSKGTGEDAVRKIIL